MPNIVMAWNTSQMQAVLDRWSNRRQVIPPELIREDYAHQAGESINLRASFNSAPSVWPGECWWQIPWNHARI